MRLSPPYCTYRCRGHKLLSYLMRSAGEKNRWDQVRRGIRLAGLCLLILGWITLVFSGLAIAFSPDGYRTVLGWAMVGISLSVAVVIADRWVKILPCLLVYGVINGLRVIVTDEAKWGVSNHVFGPVGIIIILLMGGCVYLSLHLIKSKLSLIDKMSLFFFLLFLFVGMWNNCFALFSTILMCCSLIVPWVWKLFLLHLNGDKGGSRV